MKYKQRNRGDKQPDKAISCPLDGYLTLCPQGKTRRAECFSCLQEKGYSNVRSGTYYGPNSN
jgi:hypothetical protein